MTISAKTKLMVCGLKQWSQSNTQGDQLNNNKITKLTGITWPSVDKIWKDHEKDPDYVKNLLHQVRDEAEAKVAELQSELDKLNRAKTTAEDTAAESLETIENLDYTKPGSEKRYATLNARSVVNEKKAQAFGIQIREVKGQLKKAKKDLSKAKANIILQTKLKPKYERGYKLLIEARDAFRDLAGDHLDAYNEIVNNGGNMQTPKHVTRQTIQTEFHSLCDTGIDRPTFRGWNPVEYVDDLISEVSGIRNPISVAQAELMASKEPVLSFDPLPDPDPSTPNEEIREVG